jgi:hypothetical protein
VTKDFNVTQSGRELQQGRESAGLSKQLSELANTKQSGLAGYELSLGAIDRLLNARREQENRNMESLSMGLEKNKYLYDQYQPEAYNRLSTNLSGIGSDLDTQTQTIRDIIAERLGLAQEQRGLLANEGQNAYNKQMTEEQRAYDEALRQRMRGEELTDYENKYRLQQSLDAQYPTYPKADGNPTYPKADDNERLYWIDRINQMGGNIKKDASMREINVWLRKLSSEGATEKLDLVSSLFDSI